MIKSIAIIISKFDKGLKIFYEKIFSSPIKYKFITSKIKLGINTK